MRIDGTRLDLRTMADCGVRIPHHLIGGRRCVQVLGDRVHISRVGSNLEAGIGIGIPPLEYVVFCLPNGLAENVHDRLIDRDGWLDLTALTPGHRYWLELSSLGGIAVDREDQTEETIPQTRWYWMMPTDLWRRIRCA